jgi:hypothetical protein
MTNKVVMVIDSLDRKGGMHKYARRLLDMPHSPFSQIITTDLMPLTYHMLRINILRKYILLVNAIKSARQLIFKINNQKGLVTFVCFGYSTFTLFAICFFLYIYIFKHKCAKSLRLVAAVRNSQVEVKLKSLTSIVKLVYPCLIKKAHFIIVNSNGLKEEFVSSGIQSSRIRIMRNLYDWPDIYNKSLLVDEKFSKKLGKYPDSAKFLYHYRQGNQKRIDFILESYSIFRKNYCINSILCIVGDEIALDSFSSLSNDNILNLGHVENPYQIIRLIDVVLHASNYEGFPNIIAESIGLSRRVVALDCPHGARDIAKFTKLLTLLPFNASSDLFASHMLRAVKLKNSTVEPQYLSHYSMSKLPEVASSAFK